MSRAYDVSDFAAFLRKYGDSGRDSESRTEEPSPDASQRTRRDRGRNFQYWCHRQGAALNLLPYSGRTRQDWDCNRGLSQPTPTPC